MSLVIKVLVVCLKLEWDKKQALSSVLYHWNDRFRWLTKLLTVAAELVFNANNK